MKSSNLFAKHWLSCVLILGLATALVSSQTESEKTFKDIDRSAWALIGQTTKDAGKNVVVAPFSVQLLLAEMAEAATGKAQQQILKYLNKQIKLRKYYHPLLNKFDRSSKAFNLTLATSMFTSPTVEPTRKYESLLSEAYHTPIHSINFGDSANAAAQINDWSKSASKGRMTQLVQEQDMHNDMAFILANLILFDGLWEMPFDEETLKRDFALPSGEKIKVDYMTQINPFYYVKSRQLKADIIRLPYQDTDISMYILLPNVNENLQQFFTSDKLKIINKERKNMLEQDVTVLLPRFKIPYEQKFKNLLKSLGITEIFNGVKFNGLQSGNALALTEIFQKATIAVDTKGTTAEGATVASIIDRMLTPTFNANRPFAFFIEHESSGNILFAGKVEKPEW